MATYKSKGNNKGLSSANSSLSILPIPNSKYRLNGKNGPIIITKPADKEAK